MFLEVTMFDRLRRIGSCITVGWNLLRATVHTVYGMYKITRLSKPCVTIFGGSKLAVDSLYAQQAGTLAKKLVEADIAVLTGGGPGIMEAASCSAEAAGKKGKHGVMMMGITVRNIPFEKGANMCVGEPIELDYFFSRKWLLINYSIGFCVFPGGLGTLDELSDLLNQIQTEKLPPMPVVLIGTAFWKSYLAWLEEARAHDLLRPRELPFLTITDDINEAFEIVRAHCATCTS